MQLQGLCTGVLPGVSVLVAGGFFLESSDSTLLSEALEGIVVVADDEAFVILEPSYAALFPEALEDIVVVVGKNAFVFLDSVRVAVRVMQCSLQGLVNIESLHLDEL